MNVIKLPLGYKRIFMKEKNHKIGIIELPKDESLRALPLNFSFIYLIYDSSS